MASLRRVRPAPSPCSRGGAAGVVRAWEAVAVGQLGAAEEEALDDRAALPGQELAMLLGLHALRAGLYAEPAAEVEDGADDGALALARRQLVDEGPVDLELVEGEALEVAERGIAGPEVVHGEPDAERPQAGEDRRRLFRVADQHALGDLELEPGRLDAVLGQGLAHRLDQAVLAELDRGEVDRDAKARPADQVAAGLADHPGADRDDEAGLLGDRDDLAGQDQAALGMAPAQQRLVA